MGGVPTVRPLMASQRALQEHIAAIGGHDLHRSDLVDGCWGVAVGSCRDAWDRQPRRELGMAAIATDDHHGQRVTALVGGL
jgi:hypothetical protein